MCKPVIRRTAEEGDWIIGTGSKSVKSKQGNITDYSGKLVYAMKVTSKITMKAYDLLCNKDLKKKIPFPSKTDYRRIVGDSIYDYSIGNNPRMRKVIHDEDDKITDLSGINTLLSDKFYYFGKNAVKIPVEFSSFIQKVQGHKIIPGGDLIDKFEKWIEQFETNKLYGEPQLKWEIENGSHLNCKIRCDN